MSSFSLSSSSSPFPSSSSSPSSSPPSLRDALSALSDPLSPSELSRFETHGLGGSGGWEVRRHAHESVANAATAQARRDWSRLVGETDEFGSANPPAGNWTSLAMPYCRAERVWITAYIIEFAFIHDTVIERQLPDGSEDHDNTLEDDSSPARTVLDPQLGKKELRAMMARKLLAVDEERGRECLAEWQRMIDTTHAAKRTSFASVDEYVEFRLVDCSARWMATFMLYGMGISLPASEREELSYVAWPFCAAAGLENDYFSFDREYVEFIEEQEQQKAGRVVDFGAPASTPIMINLITLLMEWRGIDIMAAKQVTRELTMGYERELDRRCNEYRDKHAPISEEVEMYLTGLQQLLAGNCVWSSSCPRYHQQFRYDPNAGLEDALTLEKRGVVVGMMA